MADPRATRLDRDVDPGRDHVLGNPNAEMTLVEYGSYACPSCHVAHEVIAGLRDRFGDRLRYVFRHKPVADNEDAERAAMLAEYAGATGEHFWEVHDALMTRGPRFDDEDFEAISAEFGLPPREVRDEATLDAARRRVREDLASSRRSGALVSPTFYINDRRYEGAWDESSLAEALLGSLGHRVHAATLDFVRWGPSSGLSLLLLTVLALLLANSPVGAAFLAFWDKPLGVGLGDSVFSLTLLQWINDGLLSVFFLVVGLEIKREFTVGRLASRRAAALPVAGAIGGMVLPATLYVLLAPPGVAHGWGMTIATDTAFAIALIVFLGARVPVELRVFLTAAVIIDDLVAIGVVALFYSGALDVAWLAAAAATTLLLAGLNRWGVHRALPYAVLGVVLWACLHEGGIHATLAGVVLALVTPTRPPPNLRALNAQAELVFRAETAYRGTDALMRHGPSEPSMRMLDAIHDRIESPAAKLLRTAEPWSSYVILPLFAFANAGVVLGGDVLAGHGALVAAIVTGLVVGKPVGIVTAAWLAARLGLAVKPDAYGWRQLAGAGALAGIGFTMSMFIAAQAFPDPGEFTAARIAIFAASLLAGVAGTLILWPRAKLQEDAT
ncbi:MAG TPA: Na+/H+ antiporter NhaA [Xanthomonadaceae bacterium]|nr:Na+/H+ antiporter NhaA [Xanthomonadaceae bacterium]